MPCPQSIDFQTIFESVPDLYLILDPTFAIVAVSNAYCQATSIKRDEVLGRNIFDVFPDNPADPDATGVHNLRSSLEQVLQRKVADPMAVQKYDIAIPGPQGNNFEVHYWSPINSPVLAADGSIRFIIHRVEDVTEFVRLKRLGTQQQKATRELRRQADKMESEIYNRAQEIQKKNAELTSLNSELEAFSFSISHDLRAPLRAIDGFARIFLEDYGATLEPAATKTLERICANIARMEQLIEDLLAFSRLNRQPIKKEVINLRGTFQQIMDELLEEQPDREIEIIIPPLSPCYADEKLMKQVLINFCSNAVKYTRKQPLARIEVGQQVVDDEIIYFIKDNGAGFDMQYADKLFNPFQRLHAMSEYEGTGVGLAIVQRVIARHGGKVWAEAIPQKGATFYFSLPRVGV